MIGQSTLLSLALLYVCVLFLIARYADRSEALRGRIQPLVYALSLSVYCSSWTFFGAVGVDANSPWQHLPVYLGPIILYLFAWPLIQRLLAIGSRQRATSIADFIGSRYGKRQSLAALVTLVSVATVLPYIALQLRALSQSWEILTGFSGSEALIAPGDSALFAAIIMAVFTLLFSTRRIDSREQHQGVMAAIATESLVKLLAFAAVAGLAVAYFFKRLSLAEFEHAMSPWLSIELHPDFFAQTLLSMFAILCLPRQFHVTVVEYRDERDSRYGRWLLPAYLAAFALLAVPISIAGRHLFADTAVNPDTYIQILPLMLGQQEIAIAAFIGGISAATGMVIVATVSLAIMVTNELVAPILIRFDRQSHEGIVRLGDNLRRIRQFAIVGIFLLAWLVGRQLDNMAYLAEIGFLCFLAAAQLAPSLLAGIYWHRGSARGVIAGITVGLLIWFYCALIPSLLTDDHQIIQHGLFHQHWLRPTELFGLPFGYRLSHATFWSLLLNTLIFVGISLIMRTSAADRRQAQLFLSQQIPPEGNTGEPDFSRSAIRVGQLQALLPPLMGDVNATPLWREFETIYQQALLPVDRAPQFVVDRIESLLAANIGAASAHRALMQLEQSQQLEYHDLANMVTDANRQNQLNREMLLTTVETVNQGICVVDSSLNLVAWNNSYQQLFDYPDRFLYVGCPIERVYRLNADRGLMEQKLDYNEAIGKRLDLLHNGNAYRLERTLPNGTVVDICGKPLAHGGFVTTYLDITEYKDTQRQLEDARHELLQRVEKGSRVLTDTNTRLRQENRLRAQAEAKLREADRSKSRFMAATSHDLLQPINAARLFTATLKARQQTAQDPSLDPIIGGIDQSLASAELLISALREIARLDSGKQIPRRVNFSARKFVHDLQAEFQIIADTKNLTLATRASSTWLYSDPNLLRRILQNFLSNAIRYTSKGKVLLGCRRRQDGLRIEVWDTGPGIPQSEHARIFTEFERLQRPQSFNDEGLGLGLAIAQRCADMLSHRLDLYSTPGRGTMFAITVPFGQPVEELEPISDHMAHATLRGCRALCIDNEDAILDGMEQLLGAWGCDVFKAKNEQQALAIQARHKLCIVLADYHLGRDQNGLDVLAAINHSLTEPVPGIVISADDSDSIRAKVRKAGYNFIAKPVNPNRLQALIRALAI